MTRRFWMLVVAMVSLTAGGVWAGMTLARTPKSDADPGPATAAKPAFDCCDDPTCPPGCSADCPPGCADAKATAKGPCCDDGCPPCPFCPGK